MVIAQPGEFLLLKGVYEYNVMYCVFAGLTIIFGAVYMLRAYQLSMFGPTLASTEKFKDLDNTEMLVLGILAVFILVIGFYPQPIFDLTAASVEKLIMIINPSQIVSI